MSGQSPPRHTKLLNFASNAGPLLFFVLGGKVVWVAGLAMAAGQVIGARLGANAVLARGAELVRPFVVVAALAMAVRLGTMRKCGVFTHEPASGDRGGRCRSCPKPYAGAGTPDLRSHRLNRDGAGIAALVPSIPATRPPQGSPHFHITPNISLKTGCSASMRANCSIRGRKRGSGMVGMSSWSMLPWRSSEWVRRLLVLDLRCRS